MKLHRGISTVVALLTIASAAWAWAGTYGKGDPSKPISVSNWPAGITVLANRTDRTSGRWINASDTFNYQGKAAAFNDFLAQYAQVPGITPTLYLQSGDGLTILLATKQPIQVEYDWQLNTEAWGGFSCSVNFPVNGSIALKNLKIPANISVEWFGPGDPPAAVKKLLADHAKLAARTNPPAPLPAVKPLP